jgi:hypothetical protein
MTVQWVTERADSKWTRCANALRERPGVEAILDVDSANPSTDAGRITRGDLAAFRPRGHFKARVVGGRIWAKYAPKEPVTLGADPPLGDDDP